MMNSNSWLYRKALSIKSWFGNARFYFIVTVLFFVFATIVFSWRLWSTISFKYPINHELWGQFGDFVGGTLGVLFSLISVMLVTWTFRGQQKISSTQRFNDLFFELLNLYQEQEKELQSQYSIDDSITVDVNYKDFFDAVKYNIVAQYIPSTALSKNRKEAIRVYSNECIKYKSKLSLCYRTLFRMLDLIDQGELNEKERGEYIKILRAQLTENELLCLRYHIKAGEYKKYAFLVNKYNLMKHLPLFEMLEFKYWWGGQKLDSLEIKRMNEFFMTLFKEMKLKPKSKTISDFSKYITVSIYSSRSSLKLIVKLNTSLSNINDKLTCLDRFNDKEIENLFECAMKELVFFSNFSCYNIFKDIHFFSSHDQDHGNKSFTVVAKNVKENELFLSFDKSMKLDSIISIY